MKVRRNEGLAAFPMLDTSKVCTWFFPTSQRAQRGLTACCKALHFTVRIWGGLEQKSPHVICCRSVPYLFLKTAKDAFSTNQGEALHTEGAYHTGRQPLRAGLQQGDGLSGGTSPLAHGSPPPCAPGAQGDVLRNDPHIIQVLNPLRKKILN